MTYRGIVDLEVVAEKIVASKLDRLFWHDPDDVCRQSSMCTHTNTHTHTHTPTRNVKKSSPARSR